MSIVKQAKQILSGEVNKYKTLKDCLDYVSSLEGLEQYEKEHDARIEKAKKEAEKLERDNIEALEDLNAAKAMASQKLKEANDKLKQIVDSAEEKAKEIINTANEKAGTLLSIKPEVEAAKSELSSLKYQIIEEKRTLDALQAERKKLLEKYA